jgi:flavin reductase (DIM6/NTAB) family NADH-FMN oxidoreductase RutF
MTSVDDRYDRWVGAADPAMIVLTVEGADERSGCLAGFHTQVSIEPRRHLVGVSRANHTFSLAAEATHVGVHLLASDQLDLARLFGEATGDEVDKFAQCGWTAGPHGVPVLDEVVSWFVGLVVDRWAGDGDHLGLVLQPVAAAAPPDGWSGPLRLAEASELEPGHPA